MIYFTFAWMAVVDLLFTALAYLLAPALPAFAKDGWLPNWLWWFQTPDNSLDGDDGWKAKPLWGAPRYLRRVLWLWRNAAYGFSWGVLAVGRPDGTVIKAIGDPLTSNLPGHSGWYFKKLMYYTEVLAFQFYFVRQWGQTAKCLRVNMGWKLWQERKCQFVCTIGLGNTFK